jgi:hypothetical protein
VPPTTETEPTPRTFSSRFLKTWSAQLVSSTAEIGLRPAADGARPPVAGQAD